MSHQRRHNLAPPASLVSLTKREREIIQLLAQGFSNKTIAGLLFLSSRTVQSHLYRIYRKLNVRNRTSATIFAIRYGIIEKL